MLEHPLSLLGEQCFYTEITVFLTIRISTFLHLFSLPPFFEHIWQIFLIDKSIVYNTFLIVQMECVSSVFEVIYLTSEFMLEFQHLFQYLWKHWKEHYTCQPPNLV